MKTYIQTEVTKKDTAETKMDYKANFLALFNDAGRWFRMYNEVRAENEQLKQKLKDLGYDYKI